MMASVQRQNYIDICREQNQKFLSGVGKFLLQYVRKNNKKVGVLISFMKDGSLKLGYSKCNTKLEPFDRYIGIHKAIERAATPTEIKAQVPHSISPLLLEFLDRSKRYFFKSVTA